MVVQDCMENITPADCRLRRGVAESVYGSFPIQPAHSSEFTGEMSSSSSLSTSSSSSLSSSLNNIIMYDDDSYHLHCRQTSHQCCCPREDDDDDEGESPTHLNKSSRQDTLHSDSKCRNTENTAGGSSSSSRSSRGGDRECPRRRQRVTPFLSPCVARAALLFVVLTSCLGVNLARPNPLAPFSRTSPLSDNEKHYRTLQTKAVKYLAQFGYLTGPSRETGNLMSADDLSKAIKTLQAMAAIPQTGVIDRRTEEVMSRPRCGNVDSLMGVIRGQGRSDLGQDDWPMKRRRYKRYTEAPSKWPKKNLTFRITNYTPDLGLHKVRETIHEAFMLWANATQLSFVEVKEGSADIMIVFASRYHQDGYPFDGKGMILAHAFFPGDGKGGDTHFDDDEHWTTNSTEGVDLFMVSAHEFGHALGLAHSADPGALMYPWYQGFSGKFALPRDDTLGIQKLYGPPLENRELPDVGLIPRIETSDTDTRTDVNHGSNDGKPPDPCTTPFDAITVIRNQVFLFIGKWFWRLDSRNILEDPVHIHTFWYGLPSNISKIDAVLERPGDKRIIFFIGDRYWVYNANRLVSGFPKEGRPIMEFGIPADVKRIDTVFTWGFNKRTYLVSGDMYWKLDENNTYVEYDYPRDMSIWRGVPVPLDAAFQYWDGKTYFFKDRAYWKFYDLKMRVDPSYPRIIAQDWLKCSDAHNQRQPAQPGKDLDKASKASSVSQTLAALWRCCLSLLIAHCIGHGSWRV